jgi:hypothetical protein
LAVATTAGDTASTTAACSTAPKADKRPFKATLTWASAGVQWAGVPGTATSRFGGRCSVASDYLISATFKGEASHEGSVTGSTSHCTQIVWGPTGPMGATYSDGRGTMTSANGSTIVLRYGNGTTGVDATTGKMWFKDEWKFVGGTGLFAGATGSGTEGGSFADFNSVLNGTPIPMWMQGTISYDPRGKK